MVKNTSGAILPVDNVGDPKFTLKINQYSWTSNYTRTLTHSIGLIPPLGGPWQGYLAKRFLLFIPTLLLVTLMVFALMRLIPGDPAYLLLAGSDGEGQFTERAT